MSSQQQKVAGDRSRTRGKSLTAANVDQTEEDISTKLTISEAWEATLATILSRLNKLEKLDKLEDIANKIDILDTVDERLIKLTETTEAFVKQTRTDLDTLAGHMRERDRQHDADARERLILQHRQTTTEQDNSQLRSMLNDMINKSKECNLKIEGKVEEEGEDLMAFVMDLAGRMANNRLDPTAINSIHRIGRKQTQTNQRTLQKPRSILVTFRSVTERNILYYIRTKLRNNQTYKNIYINDDITAMTRKSREDFRAVATLVRNANKEVRIHDDGIIIEGRKYKYSEADQLPEQFTVQRAKTIRIDGGLYFQSAHSFLSNFHQAPIVLDGKFYPTAEHKLQTDKCIMAKDTQRHELIMNARTPLEAKKIGDQIQETQEWKDAREDTLRKILDLKFDQNPSLAKKLIDTRQFSLHEATVNTYYGIGAALNSRELRNKQYNGENKLGQLLEQKRTKLNNEQQQNVSS